MVVGQSSHNVPLYRHVPTVCYNRRRQGNEIIPVAVEYRPEQERTELLHPLYFGGGQRI